MVRRGHLKRGKRKKARPARGSEQQLILLDQLKEIAAKTGIEVREERLHREVGYSVRGGRCVVEGSEVLLLDSAASATDCIEVLLDFLASRDLDQMYIEPELRRLIGGHAPAVDDPAAGHDGVDAAGGPTESPSAAPTA